MVKRLMECLAQLEKEALGALAKVKTSKELAAWHKRYITGGKNDG